MLLSAGSKEMDKKCTCFHAGRSARDDCRNDRKSVLPKLHERFQTDVIMHQTFLVQHYPESVLAEKLEPWESALPECIKLAYLPMGIIRLRLTGRGQNREEVKSSS